MSQDFVVNYTINVQSSEAVSAVNSLKTAISSLTKSFKAINELNDTMRRLASTMAVFKNSQKIDIRLTGTSTKKINERTAAIEKLNAALAKNASFGKGNTLNGGKLVGNTSNTQKPTTPKTPYAPKTPTTKPTTPKTPSAPKPYAPKPSRPSAPYQTLDRRAQFPVIPSAIGYKLFGPTPLPSNGGMAIDMLKGMGIAYGISGLGSLMSSVVAQSAEYDNLMATVKNILQSHDNRGDFNSRFASMSRTIRNVGKETKYTVTEVADAAKFLAMAGINVEGIKNAIRPIADIALIGDTELGETADLVTNIMTGYNINPSKMRNAADVLTNTSTMSNVTLSNLAESLKYASILSLGGVPFEEAAAAIGVLGDSGIKNAQAGTSMRTIMSNILNPTKKQAKAWKATGVKTRDAKGNMRSLVDIFQDLNNANLDAGYFFRLFAKTAASGAAALTAHVDKWNEVVTENFLSAGLSSKLADAKKDTIQGLWAQVTSVFTDNGLTAFQGIQDEIRRMLVDVRDWLNTDEAKNKLKELCATIMEFVNLIMNATKKFYEFYKMFEPLIKLWVKFQLTIWPVVKLVSAFKTLFLMTNGMRLFTANLSNMIKGLKSLGKTSLSVSKTISDGSVVGIAKGATSYQALSFLPGISQKEYNKIEHPLSKGQLRMQAMKLFGSSVDMQAHIKAPYLHIPGIFGDNSNYLFDGAKIHTNTANLSKANGGYTGALPKSNKPTNFKNLKYYPEGNTALDALRKTQEELTKNENRKVARGQIRNAVGSLAGQIGGGIMLGNALANFSEGNYVTSAASGLTSIGLLLGGTPWGLGMAAIGGIATVISSIRDAYLEGQAAMRGLQEMNKAFSVKEGHLVDANATGIEQHLQNIRLYNRDINAELTARIAKQRELMGLENPGDSSAPVNNGVFNRYFNAVNGTGMFSWTSRPVRIKKEASDINPLLKEYGLQFTPRGNYSSVDLLSKDGKIHRGAIVGEYGLAGMMAVARQMMGGENVKGIIEPYSKMYLTAIQNHDSAALNKIWSDIEKKYAVPDNINMGLSDDDIKAIQNGTLKAEDTGIGKYLLFQRLKDKFAPGRMNNAINAFNDAMQGNSDYNLSYNALQLIDAAGAGNALPVTLLSNYDGINKFYKSLGMINNTIVPMNGNITPEEQAATNLSMANWTLQYMSSLGLDKVKGDEMLQSYYDAIMEVKKWAEIYTSISSGHIQEVIDKIPDGFTYLGKDGMQYVFRKAMGDFIASQAKTATDTLAQSTLECFANGYTPTSQSAYNWGLSYGTSISGKFYEGFNLNFKPGGKNGFSLFPSSDNQGSGTQGSKDTRDYKKNPLTFEELRELGRTGGKPVAVKQLEDTLKAVATPGTGTGTNDSASGTKKIVNPLDYNTHRSRSSAAPKQVIVNIENLMNVKSIDMTNEDNSTTIQNLKGQVAQMLVDVVHDFTASFDGM